MKRLVAVEARRYLARRLTRVLIGLALVATAVTGVVVFAQADGAALDDRARRARVQEARDECVRNTLQFGDPALRRDPVRVQELCRLTAAHVDADDRLFLTNLWRSEEEGGDSILAVTAIFLGIGAFVGGASMVGAEWKAGTFTTLLTWEPRRLRVAVVKLLTAGALALLVAMLLQLLFVAALLPTVLLRGTTEGADAEWFWGALGGFTRSATLAAIGAVVGAAVAMVGRSTSAALGAAFAYLAVLEAILRAWKPEQSRWLVAENAAIFLTGRRLENAPFDRPFVTAALTLAAFTVGLVGAAAATFRSRDVAA